MKFKTALLAFLAFMSAALWVPQAQAIPAFARQVGMACSACHQQHFPALNAFGRAFKEGGFTMIGSQEKIESEGTLSLPVVLNGALVGYMMNQKTNGSTVGDTSTTKSTNDGVTQIPQQVSLFLAGRVGEHIGFESEINVTGSGPGTQNNLPGNTGIIRLKVPFVYNLGGVNAGIVPFSTGLGVADSFEVLNTGAVAVHAFNQTGVSGATTGGMQVISAQQYIGTATPASGFALIASNDQFFANVAKWGASQGAGNYGSPTSNYLRAAWTTDVIPGFDSAIGVQFWRGNSVYDAGGDPTVIPGQGAYDTNATAIDAQMLGEVGGMPLTLVASYATAPASGQWGGANGNGNLFNQGNGNETIKSFNVGAELGVIPNKATLQLGLRRASSGNFVPGTSSGNASDNAVMIGATYALALNVRLELTFVKASGDMYNGAPTSMNDPNSNAVYGDRMTTLDLAFGF
ncbi:MAG: hypothetical protein WA435_00320 [Gallionellaceae bacterium]